MTESDEFSGPVVFEARFPPEARFAATAAGLAARLAAACGCAPRASEDVRDEVSRAFGEAQASAGGAGIDLTLRADRGAFEAELACGGRAFLHCSKTAPA